MSASVVKLSDYFKPALFKRSDEASVTGGTHTVLEFIRRPLKIEATVIMPSMTIPSLVVESLDYWPFFRYVWK